MSYNAALATGASASLGFNGTWTGSNPVPTGFTLNNVACTGSTTTTPPTTPTTAPTTTPPNGTPPARTVRAYWLRPTDKAFDQRYPDGITSVVREAQRLFKAQLGKTFTLNNPVVEVVNGHDADGAAGVNGPFNRWYGGMVHELGHAFGLPDATSTDGTCMSASLYDYPNCTLNQIQKNGILNGPFASFLS